VAGAAVSAEPLQERSRGGLADGEQRQPDRERDPEGLGREPSRLVLPARARGARDHGGRAVDEEVEDRERAREDGAREAERGDLRAAQMADDRSVSEHVERLGCEGPERRHGEPQDLAVVG
jgi:hypothetical protein